VTSTRTSSATETPDRTPPGRPDLPTRTSRETSTTAEETFRWAKLARSLPHRRLIFRKPQCYHHNSHTRTSDGRANKQQRILHPRHSCLAWWLPDDFFRHVVTRDNLNSDFGSESAWSTRPADADFFEWSVGDLYLGRRRATYEFFFHDDEREEWPSNSDEQRVPHPDIGSKLDFPARAEHCVPVLDWNQLELVD
jgi:hypothetical protein